MDARTLVGSWTAESGDSNIEFRTDGTYIRVSSLQMPMTYETLAIDDEGTFSVAADTLTFTPTSGHYRRNGVDEGFDRTVREQHARLEPSPDRPTSDLILDEGRWIRSDAS